MSETKRIIKKTAHIHLLATTQSNEVQTKAFEFGADCIHIECLRHPYANYAIGLDIEFALNTSLQDIHGFVDYVKELGYFNIYTAERAKTVFV